ncbi:MAG: hypothetical protein K6L73_04275 [Cellvibrionaceae bacterium]
MISRVQLYMVLVAVALLNILYALFHQAKFQAAETMGVEKQWEVPSFSTSAAPDIDELLDGGFWGQPPKASQQVKESIAQSLDKREANELRQKVKAVIEEAGLRQVLFEVDGDYVRYKQEDVLPQGGWRLIAIFSDALVLQKKGEAPKVLYLFRKNQLSELSAENEE